MGRNNKRTIVVISLLLTAYLSFSIEIPYDIITNSAVITSRNNSIKPFKRITLQAMKQSLTEKESYVSLLISQFVYQEKLSSPEAKVYNIYANSFFSLIQGHYNLIIHFMMLLIIIILIYRTRKKKLLRTTKKQLIQEYASKQIARQKEELSIKNKNITDSINYAKRIQMAMMPSEKLFKKLLPNSFVLYKPKDIVSGDFYWINENSNKIFVAAVDCTGHGVPGAFMSIIGFELLRKITNIRGIKEPAQILNILNQDFAEIFKDVENFTLRDGMDIAFCVIDKKTKIMEFSGAFNPLYIVRDNKITEIKGDRFSVGLDECDPGEQMFKNHVLQLYSTDTLYLFTDGYADQFGGPEGKKFKYRRFRHLLLNIHNLPLREQEIILDSTIEEWMTNYDQIDDILIIGIKPVF